MGDQRYYEFEGMRPNVHEHAHVSRESTLIGDVTVEADASVWPGVILRGDIGPVRVGKESHIGDNAVVHASNIGNRVMVGHGAVINEATVEDGALVGFNAVLNAGVVVGEKTIVASGSVVPEEYHIPPASFARGVPAIVTPLSETTIDPETIFTDYSSGEYTNLAERYSDLFD